MSLILFFVSGFAGLIYQVIWTRELALAFGSTAQSASTTVAAFLCGLGIGARLAAPLLARGWPPGRLFAGLETLVALFSLGLTAGLPHVVKLGGLLADLLGYGTPAFVVARFGLVFLLLLPPCMAMGATLPILTEYSESRGKDFSTSLSTLYAVNTLGAALGALAADFVLIRPLGVFGTSALASALDAGVGLLGFFYLDKTVRPQLTSATTAVPVGQLWVIFVTGYCALSLEILWVRSLVFFNSSDVYAFSIVVSTYLFGLVLGSWLSRILGRRFSIASLLAMVSMGVLLSLVCLLWVKQARFWFPGHNLSLARFLTAAYLMLPVTLLLGAIFPLQCEQLKNCGEAGAVGKAYLWNTLGSLLGSLSAGFLLLPRLGLQKSFLWVAGWALVAALSANRRQRLAWVGALLVAATPWWLPSTSLARSLFGRDYPNIIYYQDDHYGAVALIRQWNAYSWSYDDNLIVDGFNMMSNNLLAKRYAATLSALPLLLHDQPERTLVVAFGLANSTSVAVGMNRGRFVDCVELSPTVVKASSHLEHVQKTLANPKLHIIFGDGRNYLATTHQRYDVITAEPPPPRLAGIVNLYTREYFEYCKRCLKPGGMVSHWLPVQEMSPFEARTIIRACQEVFPNTYLWQGSGQHLILLACERPLLVNFEQFQQRWSENQPLLQQYGLDSAYQMLVDCLRMPDELQAYVAQTPALSDNNPYLQHFQGQEMPDYNFFLTAPGRLAVTGIHPNDPNWAQAVRCNQLVSQILLQPYPDEETARFENWPRLRQLKQNLPDSRFVQQITRTSPEAMQAMQEVWTKNPAAAMDLFGAYFSLGQRDLARQTMSPQWPALSLSKAQALLDQP